ncbi:unnamed protein product [Clonostachys rosea]|uniref:F-box domain-containing protein n=1 Tax=Bionectria ochroleuca TaxID=29856 RepID=A0ABY6UPC8_BIOOC|nr:unnamed protein product [Clonostachys rosea]
MSSVSPYPYRPVHQRILSTRIDPQSSSLLFKKMPAEVRFNIFSYALSDYANPDPKKAYESWSCYSRPSYFAPRKTETSLVLTCKAIYKECWFLPFRLFEQVHYAVANKSRAPSGYDFTRQLTRLELSLQSMREREQKPVLISNLRVFAQMCMLEEGALAKVLAVPEFYPSIVTLTIRHTDWWGWEHDQPLIFNGNWLEGVSKVMPPSVRELNIELESVDRKKFQVDEIAKQMMEKWFFRRTDGMTLYASEQRESHWRGTSRWERLRWVRDEILEGVIDYYVATLTFVPETRLQWHQISPVARENAECTTADGDRLMLSKLGWKVINTERPPFMTEIEQMRHCRQKFRNRLGIQRPRPNRGPPRFYEPSSTTPS